MHTYSLDHLSDLDLRHRITALNVRDRETTAAMLAHLGEFQARRLFAPAGFPSMFAYCMGELGLSEDLTDKRLRAAAAARRFPQILGAIATGRLHMSGVVMLAPHLDGANASELLAAAERKSKREIELLLAERFPRPDVVTSIRALPARLVVPPSREQHDAPESLFAALETRTPRNREDETSPPHSAAATPAPGREDAAHTESPAPNKRPRIAPLAPRRYSLQLTMSQSLHDKLRRAQTLLGHQVPSGNVAEVLERALDSLIARLEQSKFAATEWPRSATRRVKPGSRHIPAHVRRAVRERDGDRCTFVSADGRRCAAETRLEFDHVLEFARGGDATVENIRQRCRNHNQHAAEQTCGVAFMSAKRGARNRRPPAPGRCPTQLPSPGLSFTNSASRVDSVPATRSRTVISSR